MTTKLYQYPRCSTCRKAVQFLEEQGVSFEDLDIVETPPSKQELKQMLHFMEGNIKKLFNTSGMLYREFKIKEKIDSMSEEEALELLSQHGKLIKRPFLLSETFGVVGFKEAIWIEKLTQKV